MTERLIDGDAAGTSETLVSLPDANHTIPTQHELASQARLATPLIGCHRKGQCSCDVRLVEDGYAYRPYGSAETIPWEWMRTADFDRDYVVFTHVDGGAMIEIIRLMQDETNKWRRRAKLCVRAMGAKSKQRLERIVKNELDGTR
jgi:hypothetical protein